MTGPRKSAQLDRADLAAMTASQIEAARKDGRLARLMGQPDASSVEEREQRPAPAVRRVPAPNRAQGANGSHEPTPRQPPILDRSQLVGLTAAEINQARRDGRLDRLLGRPPAFTRRAPR